MFSDIYVQLKYIARLVTAGWLAAAWGSDLASPPLLHELAAAAFRGQGLMGIGGAPGQGLAVGFKAQTQGLRPKQQGPKCLHPSQNASLRLAASDLTTPMWTNANTAKAPWQKQLEKDLFSGLHGVDRPLRDMPLRSPPTILSREAFKNLHRIRSKLDKANAVLHPTSDRGLPNGLRGTLRVVPRVEAVGPGEALCDQHEGRQSWNLALWAYCSIVGFLSGLRKSKLSIVISYPSFRMLSTSILVREAVDIL